MATGLDLGWVGCHMLAATTPDMLRPPAGTANPDRGPDHRGRRSFPMDTRQDIAPPCAPPGTTEDAKPSSGVVHINSRHTTDFTVIGNHLSRHRALSLVAIGLAVHIQSLPAGARIGIKRLAERFPESETRIA